MTASVVTSSDSVQEFDSLLWPTIDVFGGSDVIVRWTNTHHCRFYTSEYYVSTTTVDSIDKIGPDLFRTQPDVRWNRCPGNMMRHWVHIPDRSPGVYLMMSMVSTVHNESLMTAGHSVRVSGFQLRFGKNPYDQLL